MNIERNSFSYDLPDNIFDTGKENPDSPSHVTEAGGVFWGHQVSERTVPEDGLHIPKTPPEFDYYSNSSSTLSPSSLLKDIYQIVATDICDPETSYMPVPSQQVRETTSHSPATALHDWQPSSGQLTAIAPAPPIKRKATFNQADAEKIDKAEKRKRKNRVSAQKSRNEKKKKFDDMTKRIITLEADNKALEEANTALKKANTALTEKMDDYDKTLQRYSKEIIIVEHALEDYSEAKYGSGHSTSEQGEATKPEESSVKTNDTVFNNYRKGALKNRDDEITQLKETQQASNAKTANLEEEIESLNAEITNHKLNIQQRDARIASLEARSVTTAARPTGGTGIVLFVQTAQTRNTNTPS